MAGNSERISSIEVTQIAADLDNLNSQLRELLNNSKLAIDSLGNIWSGDASESTRTAYDTFSTKYFDSYEDLVKQYTNFLRQQVSLLYDQVETQNKALGDSFK